MLFCTGSISRLVVRSKKGSKKDNKRHERISGFFQTPYGFGTFGRLERAISTKMKISILGVTRLVTPHWYQVL